MPKKVLPTNLRIVTGATPSRNKHEAKPAPGIPTAPGHLGPDAKREWRRVVQQLFTLGLLSNIDRAVLAAYCVSYGRWCEAERALKLARDAAGPDLAGGLLSKTGNGNLIQNPLVGVSNVAMRDMASLAAEFGMTPSARTRIHARPRPSAEGKEDVPKEDEDEFFGNRAGGKRPG